MSSREGLMVGSSETQNLVLSFVGSETSQPCNKMMTVMPDSLFPISGFQGTQIYNQKFTYEGWK